jgi:hypothetical protein
MNSCDLNSHGSAFLWLPSFQLQSARNRDMADASTSIELIETDAHLASACEHFRELVQSPTTVADLVVGLDCEWRPPRGDVSVLQIATSTRCFIIRTQQCVASLPMLTELFADKSIVKVGVGVGDDAAKLCRDFGISVRGCVGARIVLSPFNSAYS